MSENTVKLTNFLEVVALKEIFRQLYSYSEITFFKFDRASELSLKENDKETVLFLSGFEINENYAEKYNNGRVILNAVFLMEDPEEIEEYNLKKKELDDLIVETVNNKDSIENFDEKIKELKKQYRILHRLTENDNDSEEVLSRPPMDLVLHSKKEIEVDINRLCLIDIGKVVNPTFFELQLTKEVLKMRFIQRVRSLEGLYLEEIHKKSRFV